MSPRKNNLSRYCDFEKYDLEKSREYIKKTKKTICLDKLICSQCIYLKIVKVMSKIISKARNKVRSQTIIPFFQDCSIDRVDSWSL